MLILLGCGDDDNEVIPYPDLDIYLQRFEQEASLRGYDFDLSEVEAVYMDEIKVGENSYCGYGYLNYDGNGLRRIEISKSGNCGWANRSDIERENLFFHEIGHAFHNRTHDESKLCDGSPLTLMSGTTNTWRIYTQGEEDKRAYYISELIDRLAALDQCIDYQTGWVNDSVYYQYQLDDTAWVFDSRGGYYTGLQYTDDDSGEDVISLELNPGSTTELGGRWWRRINNPNIPECTDVTLKVTMNSDGLNGVGAAISIRAFNEPMTKKGAFSYEYLYLTTTENPVAGELNNYMEELTIPCFSRETTFIVLFLRLMGGTGGKVTFQDIELVARE